MTLISNPTLNTVTTPILNVHHSHRNGMPYEKYFMLNAAIALEAFDPIDGITTESHDKMTPEAWTNYTDNVRATHWFERFPRGRGQIRFSLF